MGNYNDNLITLTLFLAFASIIAPHFNVVKAASCHYHVYIQTGHMKNAGTDARVSLKLYDAEGHMFESKDLEKDHISSPEDYVIGDSYFERNHLDYFRLYNEKCHTKKICKIELSHNNTGKGPGWYVDYVLVDIENQGDLLVGHDGYKFEINQWLDEGEPPYSLSVEKDLCGSPKMVTDDVCEHEIHVKTGNVNGASTDAWAILKLYDSEGHMIQFNHLQAHGKMGYKYDYFEKNHVDSFSVTHNCLISKVCKIELSHDNSGEAPGWYVNYVRVQIKYPGDIFSYSEDIKFEINQWLATDEKPRSLSVDKDLCGPSN